MEIALEDLYVKKIQDLNKKINDNLFEVFKNLIKLQQDNEHLKETIEEYNGYFENKNLTKKKELEGFRTILEHLESIGMNNTFDEHNKKLLIDEKKSILEMLKEKEQECMFE